MFIFTIRHSPDTYDLPIRYILGRENPHPTNFRIPYIPACATTRRFHAQRGPVRLPVDKLRSP